MVLLNQYKQLKIKTKHSLLSKLFTSSMLCPQRRYAVDKLIGFRYSNNEYIYRRNIQGDITHIYDINGTLIAQYVYDAYGNHMVLTASGEEDSDANSIGNLNPFRYRGYYFDRETE